MSNEHKLKSAEELKSIARAMVSSLRSELPEPLIDALPSFSDEIPLSFITGECLQEPCDRCEQNKVVSQAILAAATKLEGGE